jgi:hypothetical protein
MLDARSCWLVPRLSGNQNGTVGQENAGHDDARLERRTTSLCDDAALNRNVPHHEGSCASGA